MGNGIEKGLFRDLVVLSIGLVIGLVIGVALILAFKIYFDDEGRWVTDYKSSTSHCLLNTKQGRIVCYYPESEERWIDVNFPKHKLYRLYITEKGEAKQIQDFTTEELAAATEKAFGEEKNSIIRK